MRFDRTGFRVVAPAAGAAAPACGAGGAESEDGVAPIAASVDAG